STAALGAPLGRMVEGPATVQARRKVHGVADRERDVHRVAAGHRRHASIWVAGIADAVLVCIGLRRIRDARAIVLAVRNPVLVLIRIWQVRVVVVRVTGGPDKIAVSVFLVLVRHRWAVVDTVGYAVC